MSNNNKKLIFIVSSPRSGSTLLLSYLCGIPNTKVLYETRYFTSMYLGEDSSIVQTRLKYIADYFDSFEEEIVIEKTPEHVFHLEDIEKLRDICKRDIYVIYIVRPPVPTILSLIKAAKDSPELFGDIDLLGACEKYEESLVTIYNNLILKSKQLYSYTEKRNVSDNFTHIDGNFFNISIPYEVGISYRELIENPYKVIHSLIDDLYLGLNTGIDIQSLIDDRVSNTQKYLPSIATEKHHANVLREIEEVELERTTKIGKQITEGLYIRNYFEHPITKKTIYDLVVSPKVLEIKENPEVYVVIPLHNKEEYIEETLSSIANQTYKNIRVVVIDDASTDNSFEVAEIYISSLSLDLRDKFSLIRYDSNQGVSYIRNKGLALCTDIISFCDADDVWDEQLVEKSVNTFIKYPYVDCVYSRVLHKRKEIIEKDKSKICNGNVFNDSTKFNFLTCGSNLFIRREVLENNDIEFDLSFNGVEDWDFLIQLSKVAIFKCTKEYLVTYRRLEDSLSSNNKEQVDQGKTILRRYVEDKNEFSRTFTRLFLYYFSFKNISKENIKDLDYRFILETIVNKCKSIVKSYLP